MGEFHQDFGVISRSTQRLEHLGHLLDADYVSHHCLWFDFTGRESIDRFVEVSRIVAEHEGYIDFPQDTLQGLNLVRFHTDPNHHDLSTRRHHADRLSQRAFDSDTFEYQVEIATCHLANLIGRIL